MYTHPYTIALIMSLSRLTDHASILIRKTEKKVPPLIIWLVGQIQFVTVLGIRLADK